MNRNLREKTLRPEVRAASVGAGRRRDRGEVDLKEKLDDRIRIALHAANEKKASDLTVLDLRGIATFTDFFVISSGANPRQVQAIADEIVEQLKLGGVRAARIEGYQTAEWILADYGDLIIHVFVDRARRFYDLERLWREAQRLDLSPDQVERLADGK